MSGPDGPVWIAAMARRDAFPMSEDDVRRAEAACKMENEIHCQHGRSELCTDDGIDDVVFQAVTQKVGATVAHSVRSVDFVEVFAGSAGASHQVVNAGRTAVAIDKKSGRKWDNVATTAGLIYVALTILALRVGGTGWFAPQCSTWVNCARGHTHRSRDDAVGNTARDDVREANCIGVALRRNEHVEE